MWPGKSQTTHSPNGERRMAPIKEKKKQFIFEFREKKKYSTKSVVMFFPITIWEKMSTTTELFDRLPAGCTVFTKV